MQQAQPKASNECHSQCTLTFYRDPSETLNPNVRAIIRADSFQPHSLRDRLDPIQARRTRPPASVRQLTSRVGHVRKAAVVAMTTLLIEARNNDTRLM